MITVQPPTAERLADMRERQSFYRPGIERLMAAAHTLAQRAGHATGSKVWLAELAPLFSGRTLDPITASLLVAWNQLGWISLVRRDLAPQSPEDQILAAASQVDVDGRSYHYLDIAPGRFVANPADRAAPYIAELDNLRAWADNDSYHIGPVHRVIVQALHNREDRTGKPSPSPSTIMDGSETVRSLWLGTLIRLVTERAASDTLTTSELAMVSKHARGIHGTSLVDNPAGGPSADGVAKFREFHRKDPRTTGAFHPELARATAGAVWNCPRQVVLLGDAKHVLYRSDKVDPETLKQPKKPIDYIHEHDSMGVQTFAPIGFATRARRVDVPDFIRQTDTLVRLGDYLGLAYQPARGRQVDMEGFRGMELYCTPCGHALLVIEDKCHLLFLVWGGDLGVKDVGIIG